MTIKSIARRLIGEQLTGSLEFYRFPERGQAWGGPFNGQELRVALVNALMERLSPVAIVETGTYLGTTTEFLAKSGRPIYTVESDPRAYGFARARLRKRHNVTLLRGDSREALCRWFDGALRSLASRTIFFYLDAHGGSSLPLAQELDVIFAQCPPAIVMIDDFEVPGDEAYGYDDYGPGNALTPDYIADAMQAYALAAFYPAAPAVEETGARRGCVILVRRAIHGTVLASLHLLRPAAGRFEAETTTGISSNTAYPAMTRWAKDCSVTFRHIQEGWLAANLSIRVTPERGPGVPAGFGFKASDIRRLHGEGIGPTEIAKRLGISRASVYRVLNLSV